VSQFTEAILKLLKDAPALLFAIIICWLFTFVLGNKLDQTNEILLKISTDNAKLIDRMESEARQTDIFVEKQEETLRMLERLQ
jgi:ABC-type protease/lipase transport system fused ATPase/permease subunit